jgi:hypothetical protein
VGAPGGTGPTGPAGPQGPGFKKIVIVSPSGSAASNGSALTTAVGAVTASSSSPVEVLVEPGEYDLGGSTLTLPSDVSLVGSGENMTTISDTVTTQAALVVPSGDSVRDLTLNVNASSTPTNQLTGVSVQGPVTLQDDAVVVDYTGTASSNVYAVALSGTATALFDDDTVTANGGGDTSVIDLGTDVVGSTEAVTIRGGTYTANSPSGNAEGASLAGEGDLLDAVINANGDMGSDSVVSDAGSQTGTALATITVQNSQLTGGLVANSGDEIDAAASMVTPTTVFSGGTLVCVDDWTPTYGTPTPSCGA